MRLYDKAKMMLDNNNGECEDETKCSNIEQTGETHHEYYQITPNGDNEEDIMWLHLVTESTDDNFLDLKFKKAELSNNADTPEDYIKEEISLEEAEELLTNL